MRKPWMKFYPSDWRADPALRMCSIGARGLWMEMICVMHEAEPYGSLLVNGMPVSEHHLSGLAGVNAKDVRAFLSELKAAGVFSQDDNGTIYSRRMRRDEEKSERDKANGKMGGNRKLMPADNGGVNPTANGEDKAQRLEARVYKPEKKKDALPSAAPLVKTQEFELFERGKKILGDNAGGMIANLLKAKGSVAQARAAIEQSSEKQDPREYISKIIRKGTGPPDRDGYGDPAL